MKFVFFSVSENGENGLGDEGADGDNAPQNFWDRTAPAKLKKIYKHMNDRYTYTKKQKKCIKQHIPRVQPSITRV